MAADLPKGPPRSSRLRASTVSAPGCSELEEEAERRHRDSEGQGHRMGSDMVLCHLLFASCSRQPATTARLCTRWTLLKQLNDTPQVISLSCCDCAPLWRWAKLMTALSPCSSADQDSSC